MSTARLEQRVAAIELQYAELLERVQDQPAKNAWPKVVGMFADDLQIEELHKETLRIREADRAVARDGSQGEM